jgi:hypothetical protein
VGFQKKKKFKCPVLYLGLEESKMTPKLGRHNLVCSTEECEDTMHYMLNIKIEFSTEKWKR